MADPAKLAILHDLRRIADNYTAIVCCTSAGWRVFEVHGKWEHARISSKPPLPTTLVRTRPPRYTQRLKGWPHGKRLSPPYKKQWIYTCTAAAEPAWADFLSPVWAWHMSFVFP